MKIRTEDKSYVETDDLDNEQLQELLYKQQDTIDWIEFQIGKAKAEKIDAGKSISSDWMNRAEYSLRRKRRDVQRLQKIISRRDKTKKEAAKSRAEFFVDICKEQLPNDTFCTFSAKAEDRRLEAIRRAETENAR